MCEFPHRVGPMDSCYLAEITVKKSFDIIHVPTTTGVSRQIDSLGIPATKTDLYDIVPGKVAGRLRGIAVE